MVGVVRLSSGLRQSKLEGSPIFGELFFTVKARIEYGDAMRRLWVCLWVPKQDDTKQTAHTWGSLGGHHGWL